MSTTETASQRFQGIDDWTSSELVAGILEGQFAAIAAVHAARAPIAVAIERGAERLGATGRLIFIGAGTSGRVAMQDAAELPPTFNWPQERAITLMAGGQDVFFQATEGAEDDEHLAIEGLEGAGINENDVVIALAASGNTPFAVAGLAHARKRGALSIGIFNNRDSTLGEIAELPVFLDTGTEFLAGSTRMKAGTAQKAALNCISTGIMIRLGFVYRGLMVELRPTNAKLRARAGKMVVQITGCDEETAAAALEATDGDIKLSCVMIARELDLKSAEAHLEGAGGRLGPALA